VGQRPQACSIITWLPLLLWDLRWPWAQQDKITRQQERIEGLVEANNALTVAQVHNIPLSSCSLLHAIFYRCPLLHV
jgi:hypothetical protein